MEGRGRKGKKRLKEEKENYLPSVASLSEGGEMDVEYWSAPTSKLSAEARLRASTSLTGMGR